MVGRPFVKGQSGNISGRPKKDPLIAEAEKLTRQEFAGRLLEFANMTKSEMKKKIENPKTKMLELMFGRLLFDAANGKIEATKVILDRVLGKVREDDSASGALPASAKIIVQLPPNGYEAIESPKLDERSL